MYDLDVLNAETQDCRASMVWDVSRGKVELDSLHVYAGRYAFRLSPTFEGENNRFFSEMNYSLPLCRMEGDQVFYRIVGDSLALRGRYSYVGQPGRTCLYVSIRQEYGVSPVYEQSLDVNPDDVAGEWKPFCIKTALLDSASVFILTLAAEGAGTLWIDDLELTVDGALPQNRQQIYFAADKDEEFAAGSGLTFKTITPRQLADLCLLAKIWGFIKYYHPEVAAGRLQWDYELFRIMPAVWDAPTARERNERLAAWVNHLNRNLSVEASALTIPDTTGLYSSPVLGWTDDYSELGSELVSELHKIKQADRAAWNYYIRFDNRLASLFPDEFMAEKRYPSVSWQDAGYRVLTLFRYWNAIAYCYPYRQETGSDWEKVLEKYLSVFIGAESESEYLDAVYALTAEINDSHGWMRSTKPYMFAALFDEAGHDVLVKKSYSCQLQAGDVLLRIGGKEVDEVIAERQRLVNASNEATRRRRAILELNRWDSRRVDAVCVRGNDTLSVVLTDFNLLNEIPGCTSVIEPYDYQEKLASKNIVYLPIGALGAEMLTEMEDRLMRADGLILDCRGYPTDDSFYDTLSDLLFPHPVSYMEIARLDIRNPGVFSFDSEYTAGRENPDAYKGKLVILVNSETQSAAETAVMMFQKVPGSMTVGSQSAGADGSAVSLALPGGLETIFTGEGCYYPGREAVQRKGVRIDCVVCPTKERVLEGRDEPLEKAIELIGK